jgi:hypothetical protein
MRSLRVQDPVLQITGIVAKAMATKVLKEYYDARDIQSY